MGQWAVEVNAGVDLRGSEMVQLEAATKLSLDKIVVSGERSIKCYFKRTITWFEM